MLQLQTTPFFDPRHFAQAVVLGGVTMQGIFEDAYAVAEVGVLGMGTTSPTVLLPSASVPDGVVGMPVQVGGKHFTVENSESDGTGCTLLILEVRHG